MPSFKDIGDRFKFYEGLSTVRLMPYTPVIVRIDGKAFHSLCKGLNKPFDFRICNLMDKVTKFVAKTSSAVVAYTQSDEISLILMQKEINSQIYFDGKVQKIQSVLASYAGACFTKFLPQEIASKNNIVAFDCRCFSVPDKSEAINYLIWREQDAIRNSIQALARSKMSQKQLHGKNCKVLLSMFPEWHSLNPRFQKGVYFFKRSGYAACFPEKILTKMSDKIGFIFDE